MKKKIIIVKKDSTIERKQLPLSIRECSMYFHSNMETSLHDIEKDDYDALIIFADAVSNMQFNKITHCDHPIMSLKGSPPIYASFAGVMIYPKAQEVYKDGKEIHFSPIESQIIWLLFENRNELVSYQTFYAKVWKESYIKDNPEAFADYKIRLASHITSIRKKLNLNKDFASIVCINEKGYKFKEKPIK